MYTHIRITKVVDVIQKFVLLSNGRVAAVIVWWKEHVSDDMVRLECHLYGVEMAFETINGIEIEGMCDENCLFDFIVLYPLYIPHHHRLNITGSVVYAI